MIPTQLLKELEASDPKQPIFCEITELGITGHTYIFGQVSPGYCGVHVEVEEIDFQNKSVSVLAEELKLFIESSETYQTENEFLLAVTRDLSPDSYEWRYFPVTQVRKNSGRLVLSSEGPELKSLRTLHKHPELDDESDN